MSRAQKITLLIALYFAQGLPFGFFTIVVPAMLRQSGTFRANEISELGKLASFAATALENARLHDITVQAQLPWDTQLTLSIQNLFDKDPPDAPSNYNYDYTTGNPLGRVFEIGVKKHF